MHMPCIWRQAEFGSRDRRSGPEAPDRLLLVLYFRGESVAAAGREQIREMRNILVCLLAAPLLVAALRFDLENGRTKVLARIKLEFGHADLRAKHGHEPMNGN